MTHRYRPVPPHVPPGWPLWRPISPSRLGTSGGGPDGAAFDETLTGVEGPSGAGPASSSERRRDEAGPADDRDRLRVAAEVGEAEATRVCLILGERCEVLGLAVFSLNE
jgi:hypothetical protein